MHWARNVWIALALGFGDLTVGVWLVRYGVTKERRRREPVVIVGGMLVLVAVFLGYVAWRAGHPRVHKV